MNPNIDCSQSDLDAAGNIILEELDLSPLYRYDIGINQVDCLLHKKSEINFHGWCWPLLWQWGFGILIQLFLAEQLAMPALSVLLRSGYAYDFSFHLHRYFGYRERGRIGAGRKEVFATFSGADFCDWGPCVLQGRMTCRLPAVASVMCTGIRNSDYCYASSAWRTKMTYSALFLQLGIPAEGLVLMLAAESILDFLLPRLIPMFRSCWLF